MLQNMEGHLILGYGDRTTGSDLRLLDGAEAGAEAFLADDAEAGTRVERIEQLIEGFESPLGLELLTTVHWAAVREGARTPDEARQVVADWTKRKREVFGEREVAIAWERLHRNGWLDSIQATQMASVSVAATRLSAPTAAGKDRCRRASNRTALPLLVQRERPVQQRRAGTGGMVAGLAGDDDAVVVAGAAR